MLNQPEQQPWEAKPVRDKGWINFRCQLCGQCCRNLEDSVMVESLDAYRITKYLRDHGRPELEISNFFEEYTAVRILEGKLPIMTMNTVGDDHACVFLKDNRCSIYPARPGPADITPSPWCPASVEETFSGSCVWTKRSTLRMAGYL